MKKYAPLTLSVLSGLLLFLAWPVSPLTFLIFAGFVPLLWIEHQGETAKRFFSLAFITMLIWNAGSTWWIINSTLAGGISAIVANALLMCIPWMGFFHVKKKFGALAGYTALVTFWLTFEYIHLNWELSWPWLTLGNAFASKIEWVQWYEYTGTSGGSLWILLVNVFFFLSITKSITQRKLHIRSVSMLLLFLALPLLISLYSINTVFKQRTPDNVVIVQPNVDPYQKFVQGTEATQLDQLISLSEKAIDSGTRLVVWPETAIPLAINEDDIATHFFLEPVRAFLKRHPDINLLSGVEGFRFFDHSTKYSQRTGDGKMFYESYNSAALFDSASVQVYHKSKLVPGVETLPSFLQFLGSWFEQFGGTAGGYARQEERTVLIAGNSRYKIAPAICYESIYGDFMRGFIKRGANIICIITNDGWWGDTPGYKQHKAYARLRAVETRSWVVRSANTGISCFIDPYGKVYKEQRWDIATTIKMPVPVRERNNTFFVQHGDFISPVAITLAVIFLLLLLSKLRLHRFHLKRIKKSR